MKFSLSSLNWRSKVRGKKLKQLAYPKIGTLLNYHNLDDDPIISFKQDGGTITDSKQSKPKKQNTHRKGTLDEYLHSTRNHDPIKAFDHFCESLSEGNQWNSRQSVIQLGLHIYNSTLLSDLGKKNRIKILLNHLKGRSFSHTSDLIQLIGFVNRHTFKSTKIAIEYLNTAKNHGGITSNILGNVIIGLCQNENPSAAFRIWKDNFNNIYPKVALEKYRWLHIILDKFGNDPSSNFSQVILEDPKVLPVAQLYSHTFTKYLLQKNESNVNQTQLLPYFELLFKERCNNLSLSTWCDILKICDLHNLNRLKVTCIKILSSLGIDVDILNNIMKMEMLLKENRFNEANSLFAEKIAHELDNYPGSHMILNQILILMCESSANTSSKILKGELLGLINVYYTRLRNSKKHINSRTYLSILREYANVGNHKRCFGIILNMKRRGLILTEDHYYYLIDAYCKCGSVILANQILQEMKKRNLKPNSKIFGTIICAYLSQGEPNYTKAFSYLKQMPLLNINLDSQIYLVFTEHFSKTNEFSKAYEWMNLLQDMKKKPPIEVYHCLMKICLEKKPDLVPSIFEIASGHYSSNFDSSLLLFKSFCALSDVAKALSLWNNMESLRVNSEALYSMLQLIQKTKKFSLLESLESTIEACTTPNSNILISEIYLRCLIAQSRFEKIESFILGYIIPQRISITPKLANLIIFMIPKLPTSIKSYLKTHTFENNDQILATFDPQQLHYFIVRNLNLEKEIARKIKKLGRSVQG